MLVRALLVLLLVLNVGVATWWTLRTSAAPRAGYEPPPGVAELQLVSEARPAAAPAPAARTATTMAAPPPKPVVASGTPVAASAPAPAQPASPPPAAARCYSVGPFNDASAAANARDLLLAVSTKVVPREQSTGSARGWRVYLPAAATLEEAQGTAQRIAAAGFNDFFVVRQGGEANSIALGRYRNEDSAQRRAQTLTAAGFAARAEPLGDGRTSVWLDLVANDNFDPARAQAAVLAPARPLDCARIR